MSRAPGVQSSTVPIMRSRKGRFDMKKTLSVLPVMALITALAFGQSEGQKEEKGGATERERVKESGQVLKEILDAPDKGIPKSVLDGSKCVIILPSVKKVA